MLLEFLPVVGRPGGNVACHPSPGITASVRRPVTARTN